MQDNNNDNKSEKEKKHKDEPFKDNWIEARVTKKGTDTSQMTTWVVFVRRKENIVKTKDRKGKFLLINKNHLFIFHVYK